MTPATRSPKPEAWSLEDLWREHRRFAVSVAAALVVFFAGLSAVWSTDGAAQRIARRNREMEAEIRALSGAIAGREGREAGVAAALRERVGPALRASVELEARPAFSLEEGASPFIAYRQAIEVVELSRAEALRRNIACPEDLGFVKDPPEERVRLHIASADLIERALSAAVAARVRAIESLRPADPEYVRLSEEEGAEAEEGSADAAPWLRRLPVRLVARGTLDALELLLSRFQRPGSCLELSGLKVSRAAAGPATEAAAEGGAELRFELELGALALVPPGEAKAARAAAPGARRAAPVRPGGRLR